MFTCWLMLDVDINKSHVDMNKSHVDIDMSHADIKKSHVKTNKSQIKYVTVVALIFIKFCVWKKEKKKSDNLVSLQKTSWSMYHRC